MTAALKYFRSELSTYFMWSDHGRELCWCNGTTIAFHEEITAILDRLAEQNLPDLSSIALALGTLRTSWPDVAAQLTNAVSSLRFSKNAGVRRIVDSREDVLAVWPDSLRKLTLLTRYVEQHSPSISQRAELLAVVFRDFSSGYGSAAQDELAQVYRSGLPAECVGARDLAFELKLLLPESVFQSMQSAESNDLIGTAVHRILRLIRIANSLAAGMPFESVAELEQLLKTGIVDIVEAPEEPLLDQRAQTRRLLEQLSDDHELSGFARLARQLIAAISLPRTLSEPDELQIGGVSDISNRGHLDQLLLSELAHDDLTLSVRLALNEALYLRRESPPSPLARTRAVLIDLSLPMWGIPRLFATAAALALHASSDKLTRIECFRSSADAAIPSILTTRDGLTEQLAALEPTEHPGGALNSFVQMMGDESESAEPVIITTSDVLANDAFRRALDKASTSDFWLIIVERDGRLEVRQRTRQGTSIRKQLKLPLTEILSPRTAENVHRKNVPDGLPAIYHLNSFPLLLSHQLRVGRLWTWGDTAIALTDDGRLMHWIRPNQGARELVSGLASGGIKGVFLVARNDTMFKLLVCSDSEKSQCLVTLHGLPPGNAENSTHPPQHCRVSVTPAKLFPIRTVADVFLTNSALLVFGANVVGAAVCTALDPETGERLGERTLGTDLKFRLRRCMLTRDEGFCVLNWEAGHSSWVFQRLPEIHQGHLKTIETSHGRYISLNQDGELFDPLDPQRFKMITHHLLATGTRLHEFRDISSDGRFVVIGHQDERNSIVDLEEASLVAAESLDTIESERAQKSIRTRVSHHKFRRIGTDNQRIVFMGANGQHYEIRIDSSDREIRLGPGTGVSPQFVEFHQLPLNANIPHAPVLVTRQAGDRSGAELDDDAIVDVVLTGYGSNKISVIKTVRGLNGIGLKEAKDLVENLPVTLKQNCPQKYAEEIKRSVETAGGTCEIRPTKNKKRIELSGYTLQQAEWANGSKAWLDSRGLLHLKSANSTHPEVTLVLRDGSLSGWLSSGDVFGDDYYIGKYPAASGLHRITPANAWNLAIRPFIESVPWNFLFTSDTTQTGNTALPGY